MRTVKSLKGSASNSLVLMGLNSLQRGAGGKNLSLIVKPRFDLIVFNSEFHCVRDKSTIKFYLMILNLKEKLINTKRVVEKNPVYQNVVKVFQINSFLTKGYFIKFLV